MKEVALELRNYEKPDCKIYRSTLTFNITDVKSLVFKLSVTSPWMTPFRPYIGYTLPGRWSLRTIVRRSVILRYTPVGVRGEARRVNSTVFSPGKSSFE